MADIGFVNLPVTDDALNIIEPCMHLNDIFIYSSKFMPYTDEVLPLKKLEKLSAAAVRASSNTRKSITEITASLGIKLNAEIEAWQASTL